MKSRICVSVLASLVLAATLCAIPPADNAQPAASRQDSAQTQSVSGKIASVGKTSFTLTVASTHMLDQLQTTPAQEPTDKSMTFMIDKNTTIDGKLKVGANADVTYRQEGGNNIAISVRVAS